MSCPTGHYRLQRNKNDGLTGPIGDTGLCGPTGAQGPQGPQGPQGLTSVSDISYASVVNENNQRIVSSDTVTMPTALILSGVKLIKNMAVLNNTQLSILNSGIYRFSFNIHFHKLSPGKVYVFVWVTISGVDLKSSMTQYTIVDTDIEFVSSSYILSLLKNCYIEIMFYSNDSTVETIGTPLFSINSNASSLDIFQLD